MKAKPSIHACGLARAAILLAAVFLYLAAPVHFGDGASAADVADQLDLREANVTAVDIEKSGTGAYQPVEKVSIRQGVQKFQVQGAKEVQA